MQYGNGIGRYGKELEKTLADPRILILDEATSSVDAEAEYLIQQALDEVLKGRTALVIAHQLSTIRYADKIIALEGGAHPRGGGPRGVAVAGRVVQSTVPAADRAGGSRLDGRKTASVAP